MIKFKVKVMLAMREMTQKELAEKTGLAGQTAAVAGWLNRAAANPELYPVERKFSADVNDWVYTVK